MLLLLVPNEMLDRRNDAFALHALNRLSHGDALQIWICAKALLVSPASRSATHRPDHRPEQHIHALVPAFGSQGCSPLVHERAVPCRADRNAGWEYSHVIRVCDAQRTVCEAEVRNAEAYFLCSLHKGPKPVSQCSLSSRQTTSGNMNSFFIPFATLFQWLC